MHTEFLKWEEGRAREGENQEVRFRLWGECSLFHLSSHLGSCLWLGIYQPMMSILYSRPWICRHRVTLSYNNSLSTSEILRLLTGYHSDCLRKRKDSSPSWCNSSHQHCSTPIHLCWVHSPVSGHGAQSIHIGHCYHCFWSWRTGRKLQRHWAQTQDVLRASFGRPYLHHTSF